MDSRYHLAQVNIARPLGPMDSDLMAGFAAELEPVNALADAAPGFVWRLQDESGDATAIRIFDDPVIMINMSVWESVDALFEFAYHSPHVEIFRRRREWFDNFGAPYMVLWWIPAGTIPTADDAKVRLLPPTAAAPTPHASSFQECFTGSEGPAAL